MDSDREIVHTYRYLRGAMVALLVMMLVSVVFQSVLQSDPSCFLGSISAYYYTPARAIFVGALCALGAALIAYKGHSPSEDVLLNFSGFMAFVVAMVPTVPDGNCGPSGFAQTPDEIAASVRNNIWSLIVVAVTAAVVAAVVKKRARSANPKVKPGAGTVVWSVVCVAVLAGELALFLVQPDTFVSYSHGIAAGTMVGGVIVVMILSALRVNSRHDGDSGATYKRTYIAIAVTLGVLLGATAVIGLTAGFTYFVLIAEVVIILLFCAYWIVQTVELWTVRSTQQAETRPLVNVAE